MKSNDNMIWLAAGITSAALSFLLSGMVMAGTPLLAPFALVLPALPVMIIGFAEGRRASSFAAATALILTAASLSPAAAAMAGLFAIIPAALIVRWNSSPRSSLISVSQRLTYLYAAGISAMALFVWGDEYNGFRGLEGLLRSQMTEDMKSLTPADMPPDIIERINNFMDMTFIIPAACGWIWLFIIILHMAIASKLARRINPAMSSYQPLGLGNDFTTLLGLLALSALAVAIGSPEAAYLGKILFIIFLLPYFIIGMVRLHFLSLAWQWRQFWLFIIYITLASAMWPMLMVAISEVARQCFKLAVPDKDK